MTRLSFYEYHYHSDPSFKIIFHRDTVTKEIYSQLHWHSSPELLFVTEGEITVNCDGVFTVFYPNEIAVIGGNRLHQIFSVTEAAAYYCLILDEGVCFDFPEITNKSDDRQAVALFKKIIEEMEHRAPFYREAVKGYSLSLYSLLCRRSDNFAGAEKSSAGTKKVALVKQAAKLIYENYQKPLSLEAIADTLGISKYYLSHIFKEISGSTVTEHLNYIRCKNAGVMLKSGKYTVSEAAYASGFSNLSYFSRIYKKTMGVLPKHTADNGTS